MERPWEGIAKLEMLRGLGAILQTAFGFQPSAVELQSVHLHQLLGQLIVFGQGAAKEARCVIPGPAKDRV